jgi:hypothetical protein
MVLEGNKLNRGETRSSYKWGTDDGGAGTWIGSIGGRDRTRNGNIYCSDFGYKLGCSYVVVSIILIDTRREKEVATSSTVKRRQLRP